MKLSIVLPTYNERDNIQVLIPQIEELLKDIEHEIIVVDDDSPDGTPETSRRLNMKYGNIRTVVRKEDKGIGSAIRDGYNLASNDIIVSIDSDLSFDPVYILKLAERIENGYDMVVGCRYSKRGGYEKRYLYLKAKSKISEYGNKLIRIMTGIKINDFSVNCRAIRKSVWNDIKTNEISNFFLFETIFKVHREGYKVGDIHIIFKQRRYGHTKLSLRKEIPRFLYKLFRYMILDK